MRIFEVLIFATVAIGMLTADHPAFLKLGQITGFYSNNSAYEKTFYIPRHFKVRWTEARSICRDYGYEIAAFETLAEAQIVQQICKLNEHMLEYNLHLGGINIEPGNKNSWYWVGSGNKIDYQLNWAPDEPNNLGGGELYLALKKPDFLFNDMSNEVDTKFLCETKRHIRPEDVKSSGDPTNVICNNCIVG